MSHIEPFLQRGIKFHSPASITLDVQPHQIAPGTEIHPGCRIYGESTSIGPGCKIGAEGPVTLQDCQLGANVTFASGFADQATFLDGASIGANAHIRPGTLMEEQACIAHCVGLKQTMLMPFVTLGSLINFCDCLMAGGTSRSNHSEVGSSFVHFNYTPRQDKATPSLFGDVPSGVLLDQPPIFLGGQGGVVGPVRVAYGTLLPAGTICRKDVLTPGTIHTPQPVPPSNRPFDSSRFGNIDRIVRNNLIYIGNLHALFAWYQHVRPETMAADIYSRACRQGACVRIEQMVNERIKQLQKLVHKLSSSLSTHPSHARLIHFLAQEESAFSYVAHHHAPPPALLQHANAQAPIPANTNHLTRIQSIPTATQAAAQTWLQSIVNNLPAKWEQTNA